MLDVVGETLDGLVLKGMPKADTLEASLDAYTKPNLVKLAESNDFEVKQSWNKNQIIEVISEGIRAKIDESLSTFENEQLAVLQEILDGNIEQVETYSDVVASAVSKGILYVSSNGDEASFTMPAEFVEKLAEVMADEEPVEAKEEPVAESVRRSARRVPFASRRRRVQKVEQRIVGKKVGRNELCPCGSGKKYKKCCWSKDQRK